eukprot:Sspe_Gene.25377::Locus_10182_Transcript_1_1_Confidence_1.000_Length_2709::g.25377::m.25377/K01192/E3.2.1.25, MANBA, manB; beta-mannosidase
MLLALAVLALCAVAAGDVHDLSGTWSLANGNGSISTTAMVPGDVHTALIAAGIIGDPYYRFRDVEYRWIAHDNWTYSTVFPAPHTAHGVKVTKGTLRFHGLDTVAVVRLNGETIVTSSNMFVTYDVPVTLKDSNHLVVAFESAVSYARRQSESYPDPPQDGIPPACPPATYNGICHANFVRKEPCSFGWDWGPAFATQGVWKKVELLSGLDDIIRDARVAVEEKGRGWEVRVEGVEGVPVTTTLRGPTGDLITTSEGGVLQVGEGVERWWPRGYGKATLHVVELAVEGKVVRSWRVGFRTVRLVQETIGGDATKRTFYFEINGVAVFIKGANFIPVDAFQGRVTRGRLERLFQSFTEANYNALRVWGGGIYQDEAFYDLADIHGIVVWQEAMFACAMYPADTAFLQSVKEEITQQYHRISTHPCVIIWSANNENEAALVQNWYGRTSPSYGSRYTDMYRSLYWDTIVDTLHSLGAQTVLASSPSTGWRETSSSPVRDDCNDDDNGDVHVFEYDNDCWDTTLLRSPRFASEFGLQSWTSEEGLRSVTEPSDRVWGSAFMEDRQHCDIWCNNDKMKKQVEMHYKWPTSNFADQVYMTQVQQAYCIRVQVEHHRRNKGNPAVRTMGALYWQANDIWETVSWSGLEYNGQWKMLHHFARHFYTPVLVSLLLKGSQYEVHVVSDLTSAISSEIDFAVYRYDSRSPTYTWREMVKVDALGTTRIEHGSTHTLSSRCGSSSPANCVLTWTFRGEKGWALMGSPKDATAFRDPKLAVTVTRIAPQRYEVVVRADYPTPFVWLSLDAPTPVLPSWSDNGLFVTPDAPARVTLTTLEGDLPTPFSAYVRVRGLQTVAEY